MSTFLYIMLGVFIGAGIVALRVYVPILLWALRR